jgi:ABC-type antimicrobial peptide transport system permease subunit
VLLIFHQLLETIFTVARALLFGLPVGLFLSYLIWTGTSSIPYIFPWWNLVVVFAGTAALTALISWLSARRVRRDNIIETIRKGSLG